MQVTEQRFGNALLLAVSGRLDRETADLFSASLQPHLDNCKTGGKPKPNSSVAPTPKPNSAGHKVGAGKDAFTRPAYSEELRLVW